MKLNFDTQILRRDPRFLQIFLLSSFLAYGLIFLNWQSHNGVYAAALASTAIAQLAWAKIKGIPPGSWRSSLISGLGLCLLLKTDSWVVMSAAGILTISSKFLFRFRGKHLFNPTNFGIVAMILTGTAWISPGQWGSEEAAALIIFLGAVGVLLRVKRWDLSAVFLSCLFLLEFGYTVLYLGWEFDVLFHRFNSGTILLFAFFMITDPKTSPDSRKGRMVWGMMIAILSFLLARIFYLYQAPLIALFIVSLTTPLVDGFFEADRFRWIPKTQKL